MPDLHHYSLHFIKLLLSISLYMLAPVKPVIADYPQAPDFTLPTQSSEISLKSLKGKLVYIDFWASWCRPCKNSFPWMIQIKETFKNKPFEIIAINLDKDRAQAEQFINTQNINFIIAFDPTAHIAEHYAVEGMPSSYLVDPDGRLRYRFTGFWNKSRDEKEATIRQLLEQF